jgi:outer membrane protein W
VLDDGDGLYRSIGFKFGASAEYFFTPAFGAGVEFLYAIHGSKDIDVDGETFEPGDKLHTMNIGAHLKYVFMPESMFRPYLVAGGGLTMNKVKDVPLEIDEELNVTQTGELKLDTRMYLMGGVGAMYWVSDMISLFGEFGFDYLMTDGSGVEIDGETIEDAEVTANYYFLDFKVGLNVWFGGSE